MGDFDRSEGPGLFVSSWFWPSCIALLVIYTAAALWWWLA